MDYGYIGIKDILILVTIVLYNLAAVWIKWMKQLTLIDNSNWVGSGMRGNKAYLICASPDHMHTSVMVTNIDICDAASLQVTWSYCTSHDHMHTSVMVTNIDICNAASLQVTWSCCTSHDHMHTSVMVTNIDICNAASLQVTWSYCTSHDML